MVHLQNCKSIQKKTNRIEEGKNINNLIICKENLVLRNRFLLEPTSPPLKLGEGNQLEERFSHRGWRKLFRFKLLLEECVKRME